MRHSALQSLVSRGATERELQAELKADLATVARMCTLDVIKEEYIAFSEFPVGLGFADFVVFTDRSRMVVVFIEVKGADFNFVGRDGGISDRINRAAQQIRDRYAYVEENYEPFRRLAHDIRREVESGASRYNSLLGPNGFLHVDPQKDIRLQGIVIGGRTVDEHQESRLRHRLERESPRIKFESWDSWLRNRGSLGGQLQKHAP